MFKEKMASTVRQVHSAQSPQAVAAAAVVLLAPDQTIRYSVRLQMLSVAEVVAVHATRAAQPDGQTKPLSKQFLLAAWAVPTFVMAAIQTTSAVVAVEVASCRQVALVQV
jgi:propanediol dehydratase large subunit